MIDIKTLLKNKINFELNIYNLLDFYIFINNKDNINTMME